MRSQTIRNLSMVREARRQQIHRRHRQICHPEMSQGRDVAQAGNVVAREIDIPVSVYLVAHRPPLDKQPWYWRWLARLTYQRMGWCPDYGIEYQGVYGEQSAARHAASECGGFYMELPMNASLPTETGQYGVHDFPLSEASPLYRKRQLPFVVVPRAVRDIQLEQLRGVEEHLNELGHVIEGKCAKAM